MFKTFTQDDSLRYIYNEMKNEEKKLFEEKLNLDPSFYHDFLKLKETISFIDSTSLFEPSLLSLALIKSMNSGFQIYKSDSGKFDYFVN
jgi:L-rhamnose isomerase